MYALHKHVNYFSFLYAVTIIIFVQQFFIYYLSILNSIHKKPLSNNFSVLPNYLIKN